MRRGIRQMKQKALAILFIAVIVVSAGCAGTIPSQATNLQATIPQPTTAAVTKGRYDDSHADSYRNLDPVEHSDHRSAAGSGAEERYYLPGIWRF